MDNRKPTERIRVAGEKTLSEVRRLVHEGNVRRLIIRNEDERVLIEIPVTVGAVGVLLAPVAAAVGAVAALVKHCTIEVERAADVEGASVASESPAEPLTPTDPAATPR